LSLSSETSTTPICEGERVQTRAEITTNTILSPRTSATQNKRMLTDGGELQAVLT
jgi:hypothetical protein